MEIGGANPDPVLVSTVPPVECLAAVGEVVAMRPLTLHASSKLHVTLRRRVLHVEFATTVHLDRDIELAVGQEMGHA